MSAEYLENFKKEHPSEIKEIELIASVFPQAVEDGAIVTYFECDLWCPSSSNKTNLDTFEDWYNNNF